MVPFPLPFKTEFWWATLNEQFGVVATPRVSTRMKNCSTRSAPHLNTCTAHKLFLNKWWHLEKHNSPRDYYSLHHSSRLGAADRIYPAVVLVVKQEIMLR